MCLPSSASHAAWGSTTPSFGQIAGSKADKKLMVVAGEDGVYAFTVNSNGKANMPYNEANYEQQYYQLVSPNMDAMLRGADKIVNSAYKFEGGE